MNKDEAEAFGAALSGKTVGGWLAKNILGYGKSAVVMLAEREGTQAALKVFHPELVERFGRTVQFQRIQRELSLIGSKHSNLVQIIGGGECPQTKHLHISMEYLPWKNLGQVLTAVPIEKIGTIISQLSAAAMFLEEKNLAHRDIKPENIAISMDFEQIKLLDLGVLRPVADSDVTDVDQRPFIGTLRYSPPEFLLRSEVDSLEGWRAVTFYQIGATLHDLLMKEPLFLERTTPYPALVKAILEERPKVHHENTGLVALCNHCLVKNPSTRNELVKWSSFSTTIDNQASATAIRERIRLRQQYAAVSAEAGNLCASEAERLLSQSLTQACHALETKLAISFNSLNSFPLRTTVTRIDSTARLFEIYITFEKDEILGVKDHAAILMRVAKLDENSGAPIFKLFASAGSSSHRLSQSELIALYEIRVGEQETIFDPLLLENLLLNILEQIYAISDSGKTSEPESVVSFDLGGLV